MWINTNGNANAFDGSYVNAVLQNRPIVTRQDDCVFDEFRWEGGPRKSADE